MLICFTNQQNQPKGSEEDYFLLLYKRCSLCLKRFTYVQGNDEIGEHADYFLRYFDMLHEGKNVMAERKTK